MKLAEESGEINAIFAKHYFHGKPLVRQDILDECGDLLWYLANLAQANEFTLAEVATRNVEKLKARHGEAYTRSYYH